MNTHTQRLNRLYEFPKTQLPLTPRVGDREIDDLEYWARRVVTLGPRARGITLGQLIDALERRGYDT